MSRHSIATLTAIAVATIALATISSLAHAQDVLKAEPSHYRLLAENAHVRVIEGTLRPGEREGLHEHAAGWYYVTRGGVMNVGAADGKTEKWAPKSGESFWGDAEAPHASENIGRTTLTFILVEVKGAASHASAPFNAPALALTLGRAAR